MRSQQSQKLSATAFDVLAAALSPALIIGMIASLLFFLVIAFYEGQYDVRLIVLLGLFTIAIVLIARIAIESGRMHANAFAVPLAIAATLAMMRFVTVSGPLASIGWLINIGLLALAWYLADRITFDCTLLEEDREGVQGGLLQTLGAAQRVALEARESGKGAAKALKLAKHNPGVWVLYFALLAFPLFGLGQLAISDSAQRSVAFWLLASYLGCALALLMTTSLLAMRRYLRQRKVQMSADVTARWLASGAGLILAVLLLCMLLPLPGRSLGLIGWPVEIGSPKGLTTSRFGVGNDGDQVRPDGVANPNAPGEPGAAVAKGGQPAAAPGQAQKNEGGTEPDPGGNPADAAPAQNGDPSSKDAASNDAPSNNSQSDGSESNKSQSNKSQSNDSQSNDSQSNDSQSNDSQSNDTKSSDAKSNDGKSNQSRDKAAKRNDRRADSSEPEDRPRADRDPSEADDKAPADDKAEAKSEDARRAAEQNAEPNSASEAPASQSPSSNIISTLTQILAAVGPWFKWLTIAILAAIVLVYAVTHLGELSRMWRDMLNFLALLFGRKRRAEPGEAVAKSKVDQQTVSRPRFSSFENPFARNLQGWRGEHVVEHTFAALEAWASEYGRARRVDQTAEEFAKSLIAELPQLLKLPVVAATMLDRVMFASWRPGRDDLGPLSELWHILQSTSPLERAH